MKVREVDRDNLERARELAERAIALNETLVDAYRLLGQIYLGQKQHDRAIAQAERGVALAPNDADGYEMLVEILAWAGRADASVRLNRHALRLNPHYPVVYLWTLGHAFYLTERRREAVEAFDAIARKNPNSFLRMLTGHGSEQARAGEGSTRGLGPRERDRRRRGPPIVRRHVGRR